MCVIRPSSTVTMSIDMISKLLPVAGSTPRNGPTGVPVASPRTTKRLSPVSMISCGTQVRSGTTWPRKVTVLSMPCAPSPPGGVGIETTSGENSA